jgi:two-component system response regulator PrrA
MFFKRNSQPTEKIVLRVPELKLSGMNQDSKKILIVDDDAVIVKALSLALRASGYQVTTAADAAEAMSLVNYEKPDLLIVDIFLASDPVGWDGFQLARWLHSSGCQAPLIIISGTNEPEYRSRTITAGAGAFLTKPIDTVTLRGTVASLISKKKSPSLAEH